MAPAIVPDHTLLEPIGRGASGEVWLARNIMGTLRAVKIIRRQQFESERPFEREFLGIQRFEPVSRSSGGLVHVLHVGRNEGKGYFYYVMELADGEQGASIYFPPRFAPDSPPGWQSPKHRTAAPPWPGPPGAAAHSVFQGAHAPQALSALQQR